MRKPFQHPDDPNKYFCKPCNQYLSKESFSLKMIKANRRYCKRCFSEISRQSQEKSWKEPGGVLLRRLQARERGISGDTSHLRSLEGKDILYLYETVWEGRSIFQLLGVVLTKDGMAEKKLAARSLAKENDKKKSLRKNSKKTTMCYPLMLVRWNVKMPFSPKNCVLLTRGEANKHQKRNSLEGYPDDLVKEVEARLWRGAAYFANLVGNVPET